MELEYRKLTDEELEHGLANLPGWTIEDGQLSKQFEFKNYKDGLVFANAVAYLADKMDHHPDMSVGYQKVRVAVNTHSVQGLSPFDLELAWRIESL